MNSLIDLFLKERKRNAILLLIVHISELSKMNLSSEKGGPLCQFGGVKRH